MRQGAKLIDLDPIERGRLSVGVRGRPRHRSLILHAWGAKAVKEILGKHMGIDPALLQTNKDPFESFRECL